MEKDFLIKLYNALSTMIDYADDGTLSAEYQYDEYKKFFDDVANANKMLEELWKIIKESEVKQ